MVFTFDKDREKRVKNQDWEVKKLRVEVFCGCMFGCYVQRGFGFFVAIMSLGIEQPLIGLEFPAEVGTVGSLDGVVEFIFD